MKAWKPSISKNNRIISSISFLISETQRPLGWALISYFLIVAGRGVAVSGWSVEPILFGIPKVLDYRAFPTTLIIAAAFGIGLLLRFKRGTFLIAMSLAIWDFQGSITNGLIWGSHVDKLVWPLLYSVIVVSMFYLRPKVNKRFWVLLGASIISLWFGIIGAEWISEMLCMGAFYSGIKEVRGGFRRQG